MRSYFVVLFSPVFYNVPCFSQICKPIFIETFITELSVEALHKTVLHRLAGFDKLQFHVVFVRSFVEPLARELRAVIHEQCLGFAVKLDYLIQCPDNPLA